LEANDLGFSKHWKISHPTFPSLGNRPRRPPRSRPQFSKPWKIPGDFFQGLELGAVTGRGAAATIPVAKTKKGRPP
jgi:hypothetical protein